MKRVILNKMPQGDCCQVVKDSKGYDVLVLSQYEAGNVRNLLEALFKAGVPVSDGDWFDYLRHNIPEHWQSNSTTGEVVKRIKDWKSQEKQAK